MYIVRLNNKFLYSIEFSEEKTCIS